MKVYISGRVSGLPLEKALDEFAKEEAKLKAAGYEVVNPVRLAHEELGEGLNWESYMAFDIDLLLKCDAIYMMQGWQTSAGARLEKAIADKHEMQWIDEPKDMEVAK